MYTLSQSSLWTSTNDTSVYTVSYTFEDWARWDREYSWREGSGDLTIGGTVTAVPKCVELRRDLDANGDGLNWNDFSLRQGEWWRSPNYGTDVDGNGTVTDDELSGKIVSIQADANGTWSSYTSPNAGYLGSGGFDGTGNSDTNPYGQFVTFERGRVVNGAGVDLFMRGMDSAIKAKFDRVMSLGFRYDYDNDGTYTYVVVPLVGDDPGGPTRPFVDYKMDFSDSLLNMGDVNSDGTVQFGVEDFRLPANAEIDAIVLFGYQNVPASVDFDGDGTNDAWVQPDNTWTMGTKSVQTTGPSGSTWTATARSTSSTPTATAPPPRTTSTS